MRHHRQAAVSMLAATICCALLSTPATARRDEPKDRKHAKRQLVLTGTWVQPGCVPTAAPTVDVDAQTMGVTCDGVAAYEGGLVGYAVQHIDATATATTTEATIVADIYGRTLGNLCGSLRLEPETAIVNTPDATGVGPIIGGSGDFAGVTGWYDTIGTVVGGYGGGSYTITLEFPGRIPTPSTVPCVPPTPSGTAG